MTPGDGAQEVSRLSPRNLGEIAFALFLLIAGIVAIGGGLQYGWLRPDGIMGAGFIPLLGGSIIVVCTLGVILQNLFPKAKKGPAFQTEEEAAELAALEAELEQKSVGKAGSQVGVLIIFGLMFAALVLSYWIGLLPALSLLVFAILYWTEREGWARSIATALITGAVAWFIFVWFLELPIFWPG